MKNFSNKYIFIYSIILVAVVAVLLSVVAMGLKDRQQTNVANEKMQNLLAAIGVKEVPASEAKATYMEYFKQELTVSMAGDVISEYEVSSEKLLNGEVRAFDINLKAEQAKGDNGAFPVYVFEKDGEKGYVVPVQGNGLWGAVWGNVALKSDFNTIIGVTFDHASETPGLGAEITTDNFKNRFIGKQIMDADGKVIGINVKKHADASKANEVDAISGGTMTSNGMDAMLTTDLPRYQKFIEKCIATMAPAEEAIEAAADENVEPENVEE